MAFSRATSAKLERQLTDMEARVFQASKELRQIMPGMEFGVLCGHFTKRGQKIILEKRQEAMITAELSMSVQSVVPFSSYQPQQVLGHPNRNYKGQRKGVVNVSTVQEHDEENQIESSFISGETDSDEVQVGPLPGNVSVFPDSISSDFGEDSDKENIADYVLTNWTLVLENTSLKLKGDKHDLEGTLLRPGYTTDNIKSLQKDKTQVVVRTNKFAYILNGKLTDPKNLIPQCVKSKCNGQFPRHWRKAITEWLNYNLENKNQKGSEKKKKANNSEPKRKMPKGEDNSKCLSVPKTMNKESEKKARALGEEKLKSKAKVPNKTSDKVTPSTSENGTNKHATNASQNNSKTDASQNNSKTDASSKSKKEKPKNAQKKGDKKGKQPSKVQVETGPMKKTLFEQMMEDNESFSSKGHVTPSGLLNSIKKTGRIDPCTPPTNLWTDLKQKGADQSVAEYEVKKKTQKKNPVVARVAKDLAKPKKTASPKSVQKGVEVARFESGAPFLGPGDVTDSFFDSHSMSSIGED